MISVRQIKAGRSMLGWSAADLAKAVELALQPLRRMRCRSGIPTGNTSTMLSY